MKIAGVIAEYNPFHSGHAWHLAQTRARTGCDYIVICMAGSYVQRGEAARLDKWARAQMALHCGADAVFELPTLFAVRTADAFARGGVGVLGGIGADVLSFGSETDDLDLLKQLAGLRACEPANVSAAIQEGLAAGKSHARAQGEAWAAHLGVDAGLLNAPNMILGAEYLRGLGYDAIADIVEVHMRYPEFNDVEHINETDLVCLGDRVCKFDTYAGVEDRMEYIIDKHGRNPEVEHHIHMAVKKILAFMGGIEDVIGMKINDLMENVPEVKYAVPDKYR